MGLNGKQLSCKPRKDGYVTVGLRNANGLYEHVYLHRIVAACFLNLDLDDQTIVVDHIDSDISNNDLSNIQLLSCSQNNLKAVGNMLWVNVSTNEGFKICRKCELSLPHHAFGKNKRHVDGLHSYCKACVRQLAYGY